MGQKLDALHNLHILQWEKKRKNVNSIFKPRLLASITKNILWSTKSCGLLLIRVALIFAGSVEQTKK